MPFRADIAPRAFAADVTSADGSTAIRVHGADPNGGPVAIDLLAAAGGSTLASVSAPARIGSGLDATAALPFAARGGAVAVVKQGAWSATTQLGSAGYTPDGFSVSIAASPPGCAAQHTCLSGSYEWSLALHDPGASPGATDALGPCHALGVDVSAATGCGGFSAAAQRLSATAGGELPVVDDTVSVSMTSASLGTGTLRVTATGVRGSLDDGSLHVRGARRQPVMASISSPRGALPPLKQSRTVLTNAGGTADLGPERNAFALRVADGATVSLSGAGVGSVPIGFAYRLSAALAGAVLSGSATPGARVLVAHDLGAGSDGQVVTASASGAWAVTLRDPIAGDRVVVSAGDPATHGVTTLSLIAGGFAPHIAGLVDQQPVRAGAVASVTGLASGASVLWGGDVPETLGGHQPDAPRRAHAGRPGADHRDRHGGPERDRLPLRHRRRDTADGRRRPRPDRARGAARGLRDAGRRRQRPGRGALPVQGREEPAPGRQ